MGKQVQEEEYEVEYINSHKIETNPKNNKKILKFEIKWKGYPAEENTWEAPESTENAKELVEQYWAIKGGGAVGRERCEKILSGEINESEQEEDDEEEEEEEEKPRSSRSSRKKPAAPTKQPSIPSKRRKLLPTKKVEKTKYTSDSENDDFSESEIEKENFRLKGNWKNEVAKVIHVRPSTKNGKEELYGVVRWRDGKLGLYKTSEISKRIPQKLIKYYENTITFEEK